MKKTALFIILYLLAVPFVFSAVRTEDSPVILTKVNKEKVEFGGRVNVQIYTDKTEGFDVMFPERPEKLGDFSFISSYQLKAGRAKDHGPGMEYVLGIYSTGTHVIPPVKIPYRKTGSSEIYHVYSQQVPVEVMSLMTGNDKDIKDIKGRVSLPTNELIVLIIFLLLIAGAFIVVGVIFFMKYLREKNEREQKELSPYEKAYMELSRLRASGLHEKGMVKEFYTVLSDILRHYIEARFSYHAPEMTTQEFMEKMRVSSVLTDEDKKKLRIFLTHCDMIKFAKFNATRLEMLDSFKDVEGFVDQTRVIEEQEEKE